MKPVITVPRDAVNLPTCAPRSWDQTSRSLIEVGSFCRIVTDRREDDDDIFHPFGARTRPSVSLSVSRQA